MPQSFQSPHHAQDSEDLEKRFSTWQALANQRLANNQAGDNFNPVLWAQQQLASIPLAISERQAQMYGGSEVPSYMPSADSRNEAFSAAQKAVENGARSNTQLPQVWQHLASKYAAGR